MTERLNNNSKCSEQDYLQLPKYANSLRLLTNEWTKKKWYIYTMEYHSVIKIEVLPFAITKMEHECIMLNEMSDKEIQTLYEFTCGI